MSYTFAKRYDIPTKDDLICFIMNRPGSRRSKEGTRTYHVLIDRGQFLLKLVVLHELCPLVQSS